VRPAILALALALTAAVSAPAVAGAPHNLPAPAARHHRLAAITAIDPTFATGITYGHDVGMRDRTIELGAELRVPWFVLDGHHYRLDASARTTALAWHDLRLLGEAHVSLAGGKNWIHTATSLGVEGELLGGYFRPCWYVAADVGLRHDTLTYLTHSELYRRSQFADAVDGWYLSTGTWLTAAIQGGYRVTPRWEVALRAGRTATVSLQPPQGLPWLADLAIERRF